MVAKRTIRLKVLRQDTPTGGTTRRWEEFDIAWHPQMNVISALMEIQKHPVDAKGNKVAPVVWESSCLEEVCGACTMLINGKVRQACSALIDQLSPNGEPITLAPMTKFPLVRDLVVDRSRMFEDLKTVKAWIHLDGSHELGPGPRQSPENQEEAYPLSRCMTCGCCMEACPQYNDRSDFMGPAPLAQVRLFNAHPTGRMNASERLDAIMGRGGLADCGNAQNCVEVCPKEIPLTEAFGELGRQTTVLWLKQLVSR